MLGKLSCCLRSDHKLPLQVAVNRKLCGRRSELLVFLFQVRNSMRLISPETSLSLGKALTKKIIFVVGISSHVSHFYLQESKPALKCTLNLKPASLRINRFDNEDRK